MWRICSVMKELCWGKNRANRLVVSQVSAMLNTTPRAHTAQNRAKVYLLWITYSFIQPKRSQLGYKFN